MLYDPDWETHGERPERTPLEFITSYTKVYFHKNFPSLSLNLLRRAGNENAGFKKMVEAVEELNSPPLRFDNFSETLLSCDQFLKGKIDNDLFDRVHARSKDDMNAVAPIIRKIAGCDFCGPANAYKEARKFLLVFKHPLALTSYIRDNVEEEGFVVGLAPYQRDFMTSTITRSIESIPLAMRMKLPKGPAPR